MRSSQAGGRSTGSFPCRGVSTSESCGEESQRSHRLHGEGGDKGDASGVDGPEKAQLVAEPHQIDFPVAPATWFRDRCSSAGF